MIFQHASINYSISSRKKTFMLTLINKKFDYSKCQNFLIPTLIAATSIYAYSIFSKKEVSVDLNE
ncbi:hypothetical protein pb186bvf_013565 [Paramecium bursaria]